MLIFALALSVLPASTTANPLPPAPEASSPAPQAQAYSAGAREVYAAPVVRPYEPPSDFGRQLAEGDADATVRTRPIDAPVAVEAYSHSYEPRRSRRELSYQEGVEAARQRQNARMGPLDGVWHVIDAQGRPLLDLVLSDSGPSRPVEGAVRAVDTDRTALIDAVATEGEVRIITAALDGRPLSLRLHPQGQAWIGDLSGAAVSLVRPDDWAP